VLEIRIRMFLGLQDPDPDPLVRCADPPRSGSGAFLVPIKVFLIKVLTVERTEIILAN
jgi:hypothetical protein